MVGESEVAKSLNCSCGAVNKLGISTDYGLNHISLDVTCKGCGKEVHIELGALPSNGHASPIQAPDSIPSVEPTQESFDALPNVAGFYGENEESSENTETSEDRPSYQMNEDTPMDPLAGMTAGLETETNDTANPIEDLQPVASPLNIMDEEKEETEESSEEELPASEEEEDATPDHSNEEEISEEEKEAFSDLFGKL